MDPCCEYYRTGPLSKSDVRGSNSESGKSFTGVPVYAPEVGLSLPTSVLRVPPGRGVGRGFGPGYASLDTINVAVVVDQALLIQHRRRPKHKSGQDFGRPPEQAAVASVISYFYVGVTDTTGNVTKIIEVLIIALLTVDAGMARGAGSAAAQLVIGGPPGA